MGLLPMLGRDLELTDAQKDQLKTIADSHKEDWKALAERGRAAHMALNQAVMADTIDEALIGRRAQRPRRSMPTWPWHAHARGPRCSRS